MKRLIPFLAACALALAACSSTPSTVEGPKRPPPPPDANVVKFKVFYATDRNATGSEEVAAKFGPERSPEVKYGFCDVEIPRDPTAGDRGNPSGWTYLKVEEPPEETHLSGAPSRPKEEVFNEVGRLSGDSHGKNLLFFIHGYNFSFEDAAKTTAKLSFDLAFDGPAVFYSWPSKASLLEYFADEATIEWAQPDITGLISDLLEKTGASNVYLVAHSMGNRGLTKALVSILKEKPGLKGKIKEVVLAAPDVDAGLFRRDVAPALAKAGRPVTLYATTSDWALILSKKIHSFPRAGDCGEEIVIEAGIETIDVTNPDSGLLNHSYVTEDAAVTNDLYYIVHRSLRADSRAGLFSVNTPNGKYWKLKTR